FWLSSRNGESGCRSVVACCLSDRACPGGRASGLLPSIAVLRSCLFPGIAEIASVEFRVLASREYPQARARRGPRSLREFCKLLPARLPGIRNHLCSGGSR